MKALKIRSIVTLIASGILMSIGAFYFAKGDHVLARRFILWGLISIFYPVSILIFRKSLETRK